jgi:hypothetical protein
MSGIRESPMCEDVHLVNRFIGIGKRCRKCGEVKALNDFYKRDGAKDEHRNDCKWCSKKDRSLRYLSNAPKEKIAMKKWEAGHRDKVNVSHRKWGINNPKRLSEIRKKYDDKKRNTLKGKLNAHITYGIWRSLKGLKKGCHWEDLVGYTVDQLKSHLEKQFLPGMSWENYGKWHIDHKIPVAVFNITSFQDIDFHKCWALDNLQPMWKIDNLKKHKKLFKPFQPSLAMAI